MLREMKEGRERERERERERDENSQSCSQITETILIFRKLEKNKQIRNENYITNQGPIFFFIPYSAEYE